jgi:TatD DNase family protein
MYFHSKATKGAFSKMINENKNRIKGGMVTFFEGDAVEISEMCGLGLKICLNGCSVQSQELRDVIAHIPLNHLVISTNSPYCDFSANFDTNKQVIKTEFISVKSD